MRLLIKNLHNGVQYTDVKYTFAYTASDPADASVTEITEDGEVVGYEGDAPAGFRVWLDKSQRRDKHYCLPRGYSSNV